MCYTACGGLSSLVGFITKVRRLQGAGRAREEARVRRARLRSATFAPGAVFVREHVSDPLGRPASRLRDHSGYRGNMPYVQHDPPHNEGQGKGRGKGSVYGPKVTEPWHPGMHRKLSLTNHQWLKDLFRHHEWDLRAMMVDLFARDNIPCNEASECLRGVKFPGICSKCFGFGHVDVYCRAQTHVMDCCWCCEFGYHKWGDCPFNPLGIRMTDPSDQDGPYHTALKTVISYSWGIGDDSHGWAVSDLARENDTDPLLQESPHNCKWCTGHSAADLMKAVKDHVGSHPVASRVLDFKDRDQTLVCLASRFRNLKDVCKLGYWERRGDVTLPGKALAHGKSKMDIVDYYDGEGWPVVAQYRQAAVKEQQKGESHGTFWYVDREGYDSRTYVGGQWRYAQPIYELTEDGLIVAIETHLMYKGKAAERFSYAFSRAEAALRPPHVPQMRRTWIQDGRPEEIASNIDRKDVEKYAGREEGSGNQSRTETEVRNRLIRAITMVNRKWEDRDRDQDRPQQDGTGSNQTSRARSASRRERSVASSASSAGSPPPQPPRVPQGPWKKEEGCRVLLRALRKIRRKALAAGADPDTLGDVEDSSTITAKSQKFDRQVCEDAETSLMLSNAFNGRFRPVQIALSQIMNMPGAPRIKRTIRNSDTELYSATYYPGELNADPRLDGRNFDAEDSWSASSHQSMFLENDDALLKYVDAQAQHIKDYEEWDQRHGRGRSASVRVGRRSTSMAEHRASSRNPSLSRGRSAARRRSVSVAVPQAEKDQGGATAASAGPDFSRPASRGASVDKDRDDESATSGKSAERLRARSKSPAAKPPPPPGAASSGVQKKRKHIVPREDDLRPFMRLEVLHKKVWSEDEISKVKDEIANMALKWIRIELEGGLSDEETEKYKKRKAALAANTSLGDHEKERIHDEFWEKIDFEAVVRALTAEDRSYVQLLQYLGDIWEREAMDVGREEWMREEYNKPFADIIRRDDAKTYMMVQREKMDSVQSSFVGESTRSKTVEDEDLTDGDVSIQPPTVKVASISISGEEMSRDEFRAAIEAWYEDVMVRKRAWRGRRYHHQMPLKWVFRDWMDSVRIVKRERRIEKFRLDQMKDIQATILEFSSHLSAEMREITNALAERRDFEDLRGPNGILNRVIEESSRTDEFADLQKEVDRIKKKLYHMECGAGEQWLEHNNILKPSPSYGEGKEESIAGIHQVREFATRYPIVSLDWCLTEARRADLQIRTSHEGGENFFVLPFSRVPGANALQGFCACGTCQAWHFKIRDHSAIMGYPAGSVRAAPFLCCALVDMARGTSMVPRHAPQTPVSGIQVRTVNSWQNLPSVVANIVYLGKRVDIKSDDRDVSTGTNMGYGIEEVFVDVRDGSALEKRPVLNEDMSWYPGVSCWSTYNHMIPAELPPWPLDVDSASRELNRAEESLREARDDRVRARTAANAAIPGTLSREEQLRILSESREENQRAIALHAGIQETISPRISNLSSLLPDHWARVPVGLRAKELALMGILGDPPKALDLCTTEELGIISRVLDVSLEAQRDRDRSEFWFSGTVDEWVALQKEKQADQAVAKAQVAVEAAREIESATWYQTAKRDIEVVSVWSRADTFSFIKNSNNHMVPPDMLIVGRDHAALHSAVDDAVAADDFMSKFQSTEDIPKPVPTSLSTSQGVVDLLNAGDDAVTDAQVHVPFMVSGSSGPAVSQGQEAKVDKAVMGEESLRAREAKACENGIYEEDNVDFRKAKRSLDVGSRSTLRYLDWKNSALTTAIRIDMTVCAEHFRRRGVPEGTMEGVLWGAKVGIWGNADSTRANDGEAVEDSEFKARITMSEMMVDDLGSTRGLGKFLKDVREKYEKASPEEIDKVFESACNNLVESTIRFISQPPRSLFGPQKWSENMFDSECAGCSGKFESVSDWKRAFGSRWHLSCLEAERENRGQRLARQQQEAEERERQERIRNVERMRSEDPDPRSLATYQCLAESAVCKCGSVAIMHCRTSLTKCTFFRVDMTRSELDEGRMVWIALPAQHVGSEESRTRMLGEGMADYLHDQALGVVGPTPEATPALGVSMVASTTPRRADARPSKTVTVNTGLRMGRPLTRKDGSTVDMGAISRPRSASAHSQQDNSRNMKTKDGRWFRVSAICFSLPEYDALMICNARDDKITFAGGKREIGEEVLTTGSRELLEEAGLDAKENGLKYRFTFAVDPKEQSDRTYTEYCVFTATGLKDKYKKMRMFDNRSPEDLQFYHNAVWMPARKQRQMIRDGWVSLSTKHYFYGNRKSLNGHHCYDDIPKALREVWKRIPEIAQVADALEMKAAGSDDEGPHGPSPGSSLPGAHDTRGSVKGASGSAGGTVKSKGMTWDLDDSELPKWPGTLIGDGPKGPAVTVPQKTKEVLSAEDARWWMDDRMVKARVDVAAAHNMLLELKVEEAKLEEIYRDHKEFQQKVCSMGHGAMSTLVGMLGEERDSVTETVTNRMMESFKSSNDEAKRIALSRALDDRLKVLTKTAGAVLQDLEMQDKWNSVDKDTAQGPSAPVETASAADDKGLASKGGHLSMGHVTKTGLGFGNVDRGSGGMSSMNVPTRPPLKMGVGKGPGLGEGTRGVTQEDSAHRSKSFTERDDTVSGSKSGSTFADMARHWASQDVPKKDDDRVRSGKMNMDSMRKDLNSLRTQNENVMKQLKKEGDKSIKRASRAEDEEEDRIKHKVFQEAHDTRLMQDGIYTEFESTWTAYLTSVVVDEQGENKHAQAKYSSWNAKVRSIDVDVAGLARQYNEWEFSKARDDAKEAYIAMRYQESSIEVKMAQTAAGMRFVIERQDIVSCVDVVTEFNQLITDVNITDAWSKRVVIKRGMLPRDDLVQREVIMTSAVFMEEYVSESFQFWMDKFTAKIPRVMRIRRALMEGGISDAARVVAHRSLEELDIQARILTKGLSSIFSVPYFEPTRKVEDSSGTGGPVLSISEILYDTIDVMIKLGAVPGICAKPIIGWAWDVEQALSAIERDVMMKMPLGDFVALDLPASLVDDGSVSEPDTLPRKPELNVKYVAYERATKRLTDEFKRMSLEEKKAIIVRRFAIEEVLVKKNKATEKEVSLIGKLILALGGFAHIGDQSKSRAEYLQAPKKKTLDSLFSGMDSCVIMDAALNELNEPGNEDPVEWRRAVEVAKNTCDELYRTGKIRMGVPCPRHHGTHTWVSEARAHYRRGQNKDGCKGCSCCDGHCDRCNYFVVVGRHIPGDNAEYDYRMFMEEQSRGKGQITSLEMLEVADKLLKEDKEVVAAAAHARPLRSLD